MKVDESGKRNVTFYFNDCDYSKPADKPKAHTAFWDDYQRPPLKQYQQNILKQRHLLAPKDKKEYQGAFYTPRIWTLKAKEYLEKALGKGFEKRYIIWDCAAGTGNLLEFFDESAKANIYASTLDEADVKIMLQRVKNEKHFPLFERHIFQFDFLNDDFSKCPPNLQAILKDEKKREKLIIFINPPYTEVSKQGQKHKAGVNLSAIHSKYKDILQTAGRELFAQFFMRIYKEIPNCILASFSTLKYINGSAFANFRKEFKAKFLKGFICPSNTFDNNKDKKSGFPIGFLVWDTKTKSNLKEIQVDIFESNGEFIGHKGFYPFDKNQVINKWINLYRNDNGDNIGFLAGINGNDFQQNNIVYILNSKEQMANPRGLWINASNLIATSIYFTVRHAIEASWLNDRDQFLYPNDEWQKDTEFQNDCLAFTLFHGQNKISNKEGANHFIPFTESEVGATKERFESHFMLDFINGKLGDYTCHTELLPESEVSIKSKCGYFANAQYDKKNKAQNDGILPFNKKEINLPAKKSFIPTKPLKFSKEAKAVFDAGREIWRYYHTQNFNDPKKPYNENASLYDIKEHFQGRNEKGRMNARSDDESYNDLMTTLRLALKELATKITPKIYEYGFLRE